MKTILLALSSLLLAACASVPRQSAGDSLLQDALFRPPAEPPDAGAALQISPAMQRFVNEDFRRGNGARDAMGWLTRVLSGDGPLALRYDASRTRNAAEAFDGRAGNCMSLVLMTGALARELGIQVRFQEVYIEDTWSRSGDLSLASGHINIALGSSAVTGSRLPGASPDAVVIDFLPSEELRGQRTRAIREETVLAMYMNNRAAELLAQARLDDAYAWARAAILQEPGFLNSYNTLGVIYLHHGNSVEAERSLRHVLQMEPEHTSAMSNLVRALADQGRTNEAQELAAQLAKVDPTPPFYFFDQGVAAMKRGDYASAKQLFTRETRRASYNHEFHFWLALAELGLGHPESARKQLRQALENSTTPQDQALYTAKLDWLKQVREQKGRAPG